MRALARFNCNGISDIILPLSRAMMESQPIIVVLLFCSLLMVHQAGPWDEISVILLFVGLHWWALLSSRMLSRQKMVHRLVLLLGLAGAVSFVLATHRSLLAPIPWQQIHTPWREGCGPDGCEIVPFNIVPFVTAESMLLLMGALILYSWLRGMKRVQEGDSSQEQVMTSFKWSFSTLLLLLVLAALNPGSTQNALLASLTIALPLFFLSSLVTLSGTHLLSRSFRGAGEQTSSTRLWMATIPILWVAMLVVAMFLEVFVFPPLLALFQPLWSGVEEGVVTELNWLASLQRRPFVPRDMGHHRREITPLGDYQLHPPVWFLPTVGIIGVVLVIMLGVFLLRQFANSGYGNDEDLVKERVSWWKVWRQHRRQKRTVAFKLEPLDPASARAQYRTFLLAMANRGQGLARSSEETPDEYQARLLAALKQSHRDEAASSPTSLLADLTNAYNCERYGGVQTRMLPYDHRQVSRLVKQLKRAARKE